ncbi:hypothetical protein FAGAP_4926 [Fusarium agapanthi]|uniref:Uncharacterized protein n=1 Tax=Fusarium agapanthi TaxID=1803897 RepID=A0A9P5BCP1_9HYPO|nr:hypothetical protein FAGAP_4926 [Fusarium agapanthi]
MDPLEAGNGTTSQNAVDVEQPVDLPGDASNDSLDSSQAQAAPERGTSAIPERVFNMCGLCKFRFHEGQVIVTENEIIHASRQKAFHTGCFQISGRVVFARGFLESYTWNLVKFRFDDSFTQPPPSFVAKRTRWLKSSLSVEIRHATKNRLPVEVCENVATYCLSEYATNLHLDAWQRRDPSSPDDNVALPVFNGQTVWAQNVEIEGRNYVKSLSTVRMNDNDTMVFTAKPIADSLMRLGMYFAEDSLGVRSVIACSDEMRRTEEPGLRWIFIPRKPYNLPFYIRMNFDDSLGLKLRNLDVTKYEKEYHYAQRTRWATPPRDLRYLNVPDDNIFESISGYVIGLQCSCIDSIIPYRPGKLPAALLDAYDNARSTWLYFPVDPHERISELWLRSGDFPCDNNDGLTRAETLIVVTSNGRSLVLGPDIRYRSPLSDRPLNYEALADLPSTPTPAFYYKYGHNESWLGFERMTTWHNRKIELSFGPPTRPGPYYWSDQFFSTSADLENLQTITPCRYDSQVPYYKYPTDNELLCLHFPMNPDERVSELWVRQYPKRKDTLIIVTDRGRSFVLGTQQDGPGATYHVIAKVPQDEPCFMFHAQSSNLSWFHFDSILSWERPQARQIQPAWKTASDMTIGTHYSSAKLDGGLLLTYYDDTRTCIGEVRCNILGTPQKITSDTLWIRYVEYKEAGILDKNTHCCDYVIEWFGFSQPLLGSFSPNKDMDGRTDEQDSDEGHPSHRDDGSAEDESENKKESDDAYYRSPKYFSLPMRGRLDWVNESDGTLCLLLHHMRSRPDDEMLHVLAEDAKTDREDPFSRSCTILTGRTSKYKTVGLDHENSWHANLSHQPAPKNLREREEVAEDFDNYDIYGL